MGVPAFFKWLTGKYGRTLVDALEEKCETVAGESTLDISLPNPVRSLAAPAPSAAALPPSSEPPKKGLLLTRSDGVLCVPAQNGIEFDNLYLDFNGIVHNCAHPEDAVRGAPSCPAPAAAAQKLLRLLLSLIPIAAARSRCRPPRMRCTSRCSVTQIVSSTLCARGNSST